MTLDNSMFKNIFATMWEMSPTGYHSWDISCYVEGGNSCINMVVILKHCLYTLVGAQFYLDIVSNRSRNMCWKVKWAIWAFQGTPIPFLCGPPKSVIDAIQRVLYICKLGAWRRNSTLEFGPYHEKTMFLTS